MITPVAALTRFSIEHRRQCVTYIDEVVNVRYGFKIESAGLLLGRQEKIEIIDSFDICPVPNSPEWLRGVINLRGNIIPVMDIRKIAGLGDDREIRFIVIFGRGEKSAGLCVDKLPESLRLDNASRVEDTPPDFFVPYCSDIYRLNDQTWLEVDFQSLFEDLYKFT